jgi:hypothetical protein
MDTSEKTLIIDDAETETVPTPDPQDFPKSWLKALAFAKKAREELLLEGESFDTVGLLTFLITHS